MKKILLIPIFNLIFTFWLHAKEPEDDRPNIIIFLVDDLGYSDFGCYGGEIHTPTIDKLSEEGVRFTQFYNAARSCPTRASMLTGMYQHQVGLTFNGQSLNKNCVTIAEVLKDAGYQTGMAGKWHLSRTEGRKEKSEQLNWLAHRADYGDFGPLESYPCNRGFDEHYGTIWGVVDYFDPFSLVHNEEPITEVDSDFYETNFITEKSIDLIDEFSKNDEPFFLYIAHNAPHWPLHALPEDIAKYDGVYDGGWDKLREDRYKRMIDLGIVDPKITKLAPNESGLVWQDCENKTWEANHMETHAAMVDRIDQGLSDIIDELKETGEYDNTLIIILADNGASPERGYKPGFDRPAFTRDSTIIQLTGYTAPGPENTWGFLGKAWAGAINSPFRYWKKESYEGGACTPMIMVWPDGLKIKHGSINNQVAHILDIMPTCVELAEADYPKTYKGNDIPPYEGKSLVNLIEGKKYKGHDILCWEHEGGKAIREGDWKMSALEGHEWELFDLSKDRSEMNNLADKYPEKVKQLEKDWEEWAVRVGLIKN